MTHDPILALARALVAALFPGLEAAMLAGTMPRAAYVRAMVLAAPEWKRDHGAAVAHVALALLNDLPPAVVMCPDVQDEWLALYPLAAIPDRTPVEAIVPGAPVVGIGTRLYRAVARLWRPSAS